MTLNTITDSSADAPALVNLECSERTLEPPLVTFAVFAYNQEKFIGAAVEGALAQTYSPLEIIISDDCSSDHTFEIIQAQVANYVGSHHVRVRRNQKNLGLADHFNAVARESRGKIIIVAAGDDISLPSRTTISVNLLNENPDATAVLLAADLIDESTDIVGKSLLNKRSSIDSIQTIHELLLWRHVTFGATRAIKREVLDTFGPLNSCCPTEDSPLLIRSLMCGSNVVSNRIGVRYRVHCDNLSALSSMRKMNIAAIYQQYKHDLDIAQEAGFISNTLASKLDSWIAVDYRMRLLRLLLPLQSGTKLSDFKYIICASIGMKERLKLAFRWLYRLRF